MTYQSAWNETADPHAYQPPARWRSRARYAPADFLTLLWRERWLMIGVFVLLFALGGAAAFTMKKEFAAHSSILVRLGQEYVYEPDMGDAARGAISTTDQIVQSEIQILQSAALHRRVIEALGVTRVFPTLAPKWDAASTADREKILSEAVEGFGRNLGVGSTPDTPVVRLSYKDTEPQRAALVLNRLIDEYLAYRRSVLVEPSTSYLADQRRVFEKALTEVDTRYQDFLAANEVSDFDAEKASMNGLQASLTDENYKVQARLREVEGRLGEMGRQAGAVPAEIGIQRDTDPAAQVRLTQLQIERNDLLSRYKPGAAPVRAKEAEIAKLQTMTAGGQGEGARRFGVNPVYQAVQTERIQLSAEAESLRQRGAVIAAQLGQVAARRTRLTQLEPQYQDLIRDRDVLMANIKSLVEKEQQGQASSAIAQRTNDNIRVVERAVPPSKGSSLKKPVFILAFLFAGFTALALGLIKVFLRRGFPTASSAARTLELPVLATAGWKERT
jgi:uncharacterized protein involved in exopolysaccharide biosynthesis